MTENEITNKIIGVCIEIHKNIGPGLFESVYENILAYELKNIGFDIETQFPVPIKYKELEFDVAYRIDLLINNKVLIELKSVSKLLPVHYKQTLTYLRLSGLKLGLLINFNEEYLKNGVHRIVNGL